MGGPLTTLYKYSTYLPKYFEYDFAGHNTVWEIKSKHFSSFQGG